MRKNGLLILGVVFSMTCHADIDKNVKDDSWYDSTKKNAGKLLESSKKAAEVGLDKTTVFLNKTGKATKEGLNAFTKSFKNDSVNNAKDTERSTPDYFKVNGFKRCISIKQSSPTGAYCLPLNRPLLCKKEVFETLKRLNSPVSC